jgi:transposase
MDIYPSTRGRVDALGSTLALCKLSEAIRKRPRRSWSPEEKRRIVGEAIRPGASIAEVARRHGLNANLVFAWRRLLQPAAGADGPALAHKLPACRDAPPSDSPEFIPIGVFAPSEDRRPELQAPAVQRPENAARARLPGRAGMIEIDLASGARVRVDALVDENALRRVLAALKAFS